jgi:co-chaperonin GroES (HSP10)
MAAKELHFNVDARAALKRGVDQLAEAVKVKGEELLVMREEDIMGVIEGA